MSSGIRKLRARVQNPERGATAVEYGLMVALIAVVLIVSVRLFGSNMSAMFVTVSGSV